MDFFTSFNHQQYGDMSGYIPRNDGWLMIINGIGVGFNKLTNKDILVIRLTHIDKITVG